MLTIARTKDPQSARIAAYLAMVQLSAGEAAVAESSFQSALALDSTEGTRVHRRHTLPGDRQMIRRWTTALALAMLRHHLLGLEDDR